MYILVNVKLYLHNICSYAACVSVAHILCTFSICNLQLFLLCAYRKTLLVASGVVVAGSTAAAYIKSRNSAKRSESFGHHNGVDDNSEGHDKVGGKNISVKKSRQKKGGLRSLKVLTAILISHMGKRSVRDFLSLLAIVVRASVFKCS